MNEEKEIKRKQSLSKALKKFRENNPKQFSQNVLNSRYKTPEAHQKYLDYQKQQREKRKLAKNNGK